MDTQPVAETVTHDSKRSEAKPMPMPGLMVPRYFTTPGVDPLDEVEWVTRTACIKDAEGNIIFEQKDVEVPASWSALATNVVASKYFRGQRGSPERESSVRALILRVVHQISAWGVANGYFASGEDTQTFEAELSHLLVRQKMSFNSPVWFNVGAVPHPQCSACFINAVDDTMDSIMTLAATEARLFKQGSGTGSNLSKIRGSMESLSAGGLASGPVSFMRGYDAFAGVVKSGGRTRRAAKIAILDVDHPDIEEFITCKAEEERRVRILIDAGVESAFNVKGSAYESVGFQNANHSVRVPDGFMRAVEENGDWALTARKSGATVDTVPARHLFGKIALAAWQCGDPGMQFDSTINTWNPVRQSGRMVGSNPCAEFHFLDNSACNLASLNLMQFRQLDGEFDTESFMRAIDVTLLAQEIMVSSASYPTQEIAEVSEKFRPLGLGYANLGALLMAKGYPYDSDAGRTYAAAITSLMTARAYRRSSEIAGVKGPFESFQKNRPSFLRVLDMHSDMNGRIQQDHAWAAYKITCDAARIWELAVAAAKKHGVRNAQVTLLAPTGTIGFMMDVDTTGVEPDLALVKHKKLVGGGTVKIVNQSVPLALQSLGYSTNVIAEILADLNATGTVHMNAGVLDKHLEVFACALGENAIRWEGHVRMMAAVQPFLSGAISKTVNMPSDATPDDIERAYMMSWKLGLKAVAVYRDGCKRSQPLNLTKLPPLPVGEVKSEGFDGQPEALRGLLAPAVPHPTTIRHRLPDERPSVTHKFSVADHEGYMTVGLYEDGTPGELFIRMSKEGSTVAGLMDTLATAVSMSLQYGVPLRSFVDKFSHVRFEPSGFTHDERVGYAKSIPDYIFRWLGVRFLGDAPARVPDVTTLSSVVSTAAATTMVTDDTVCAVCGSIMQRNGTCHRCPNCGLTNGCS